MERGTRPGLGPGFSFSFHRGWSGTHELTVAPKRSASVPRASTASAPSPGPRWASSETRRALEEVSFSYAKQKAAKRRPRRPPGGGGGTLMVSALLMGNCSRPGPGDQVPSPSPPTPRGGRGGVSGGGGGCRVCWNGGGVHPNAPALPTRGLFVFFSSESLRVLGEEERGKIEVISTLTLSTLS